MLSRLARRLATEEEGALFALFAVASVAILIIVAFVVDVGNWQTHRRHLQLQVDDGAFAAGQFFTGCFQDPITSNANIAREARKFSGDPTFSSRYPGVPTGPYNGQISEPSRVRIALNSDSYPLPDVDAWNPLSATDPNTPCNRLYIDVKATDIGVKSFFGGVIPKAVNPTDITAHARVEIQQIESLKGFLPWAIPEVDPKHVAVIFVNESNGELIRAFELTKDPTTTVKNGEPVTLWNGSQPNLDINPRTGMIVVTSRLGSDTSDPPFSVGGSLDTICSQPKTVCYSDDATPISPTSGLIFIRANRAASGGQWNAPVLGAVSMSPGTCTEDSAPYFLTKADCSPGITATVDFGSACGSDPSKAPCKASVTASGAGCGDLTFQSGQTWTGTCNVSAGSGQNPVTLSWRSENPDSKGTPKSASGSFPDGTVARPYASDDNSDPIAYVNVVPNPASGAGRQPVSVSVGVPPSLQVSGKLDPPILLRFKERNGPDTQQVDCDHAPIGPDEEVANGCQTTYKIDADETCDEPYNQGSVLPPTTFDPSPIPSCAAKRGGTVVSMDKGLAERWENPARPYGACPPNNWPDNASEPIPGSDDPRWVVLIVTEDDAFKAPPGQDPVVPIVKWAGFYVTGWDISSQTKGCPDNPATPKIDGNDPHPLGYDSRNDNGDVWGHFVNFVPLLPGITPSGKQCNFSEVGICTAVLTR